MLRHLLACVQMGGCARLDVSSMDISVLVKSHDHSLEIWTTVCADTFSLSYRFFTDYSRSLTLTLLHNNVPEKV